MSFRKAHSILQKAKTTVQGKSNSILSFPSLYSVDTLQDIERKRKECQPRMQRLPPSVYSH